MHLSQWHVSSQIYEWDLGEHKIHKLNIVGGLSRI